MTEITDKNRRRETGGKEERNWDRQMRERTDRQIYTDRRTETKGEAEGYRKRQAERLRNRGGESERLVKTVYMTL